MLFGTTRARNAQNEIRATVPFAIFCHFLIPVYMRALFITISTNFACKPYSTILNIILLLLALLKYTEYLPPGTFKSIIIVKLVKLSLEWIVRGEGRGLLFLEKKYYAFLSSTLHCQTKQTKCEIHFNNR